MIAESDVLAQDIIEQFHGIKCAVASEAAVLIKGLELDFDPNASACDGTQFQGFQFGNPNAKSVCSCGESFSA